MLSRLMQRRLMMLKQLIDSGATDRQEKLFLR